MIYTGTVLFTPDQDPYPGKYGPTVNVKLKMDDPDAPDTDETGELRLFKNAVKPEGEYIKTLQAGDVVTLVRVDGGKGEYYKLQVPASSPSPARPPKQQAKTGGKVQQDDHQLTMAPLTEQDRVTWNIALSNTAWMMEQAVGLAKGVWPDGDHEAMARSISGWARGMWRPGMKPAGDEDLDASPMDDFLSTIGDGEPTKAWVEAAAKWHDTSESNVVKAVQSLNLRSSEWLGDDETIWELTQIVGEWVSIVAKGASEDVARSAVADQWGLALPADPVF